MISYCIACYRPTYCRYLIDELIRKTTAPYEILLWLNIVDAGLEQFLEDRAATGAPLRIAGRSPENIGMACYPALFTAARYEMVAQIDDDVVCISPRIAEVARSVFDSLPRVGMLTADVWQDEFTTGARPPMEHYRLVNEEFGLYDGPIDGWFAIYRRASLRICRSIGPARYTFLGAAIKRRLAAFHMSGLLCTKMRVFHVTGPEYASYFGMVDAEIEKYRGLARHEIVNWYTQGKARLPERCRLAAGVEAIRRALS